MILCNHGLRLFLLNLSPGKLFTQNAPPNWGQDCLAKRTQTAEKKGEKQKAPRDREHKCEPSVPELRQLFAQAGQAVSIDNFSHSTCIELLEFRRDLRSSFKY
jgi:hypothetical protein